MKAIIVFYDSLNREYLSRYNPSAQSITPNFDRLAKNAVTFDNAYVGSMPCIPARRELHTGRHNFLHREWGPLEPFDDSMPEILKSNGIYTHLISDHYHYWEDGGGNYHTRYSSWEIVRGQGGDHWKGQVENPKIPEVVYTPTHQHGSGVAGGWRYYWVNRDHINSKEEFPQYQVFEKGCDFIRKNHDQDNWLLQIETFDPHEPFHAPEELLERFKGDYVGPLFDWPRGKVTQSQEEIDQCINQYKALLTMCDEQLGRVLDLMDEYSMWEDTMLIVGTDHGFLLSQHGYWGKNSMPYYDSVAHTPMFVWDPKNPVKDVHRQSLVQLIDWAPTLLDYFNIDIPQDMEGKPLTKVINKDEPVRDAAIFGVFSGHVNVTDGRYVYMRSAHPDRVNELNNYTLMPAYMMKRVPVEDLRDVILYKPFKFTKGVPTMKIKAYDKYGVNSFGTLLFDLEEDPLQVNPLKHDILEKEMIDKLIKRMEENDAPEEQYYRLDLQNHRE